MKYSEFKKEYKKGKSYTAPDGTYLGECVSLLKCYMHDVLGVEKKNIESIGNAKEYWNKRNSAYITKHFKVVSDISKAKQGDVFVRVSGTYGHVGMIDSVTKTGFKSIEQNHGGNRMVGYYSYEFNNCSDYHILRPLNQANMDFTTTAAKKTTKTTKTSNIPSIKAGTYTLLYSRVVYNNATTDSGAKKILAVTTNAKKHCTSNRPNAIAELKKGTVVDIKKVKESNYGNLWGEIPSGWICIWTKKDNVKKIK